MILPQTMLQVIHAGGHLTLDLDKQIIIPSVMVQLALAANQNKVMLTFANFDGKILPQTMLLLAQTGGGFVKFIQ